MNDYYHDDDRRHRRDVDYPYPPRRAVRESRRTARRTTSQRIAVVAVLGVGTLLFFGWLRGPGFSGVSRPPAPQRLDRLSTSQLAAHGSDNGVIGGLRAAEAYQAAQAAEKAKAEALASGVKPATLPPVPRTVDVTPEPVAAGPRSGVRLKVRSESPHVTADQAKDDAVNVARRELAAKLAELTPPIHATPSAEMVRQAIRPQSVAIVRPTPEVQAEWERVAVGTDRVWVELDVEFSETQLRQLRTHDRLGTAGAVALAAAALLGALLAYLKFDAWTRGYLTNRLRVGFIVLALVVIVLIVLA